MCYVDIGIVRYFRYMYRVVLIKKFYVGIKFYFIFILIYVFFEFNLGWFKKYFYLFSIVSIWNLLNY